MSIELALQAAREFGDRLAIGSQRARERLPSLRPAWSGEVRRLIVTDFIGQGGHADLTVALASQSSRLPVVLASPREMPEFANRESVVLLFADDLTGEGSHELASVCASRGATLVVVTSDAPAQELADPIAGIWIYPVDAVTPWNAPGLAECVPCGLLVLEALGGLPDSAGASLEASAAQLQEGIPSYCAEGGIPKWLTSDRSGQITIVVGAGAIGEAVARAWETCFRVNDLPAFSSTIHDAKLLAATLRSAPGDPRPEAHAQFVFLRNLGEDPRATAAMDEFSNQLETVSVSNHTFEARATDLVARAFESIIIGQLASLKRKARTDEGATAGRCRV
jgi:hypothetical protein